MSSKKNTYVTEELKWLEEKALQIKKSVDKQPYDKIGDRKVLLEGPRGMTERVSATIEIQQKAIREALRDYASLLEAIDKLRAIEEEKKDEVRGDTDLSPLEAGDI